jgi:hypothetical protein
MVPSRAVHPAHTKEVLPSNDFLVRTRTQSVSRPNAVDDLYLVGENKPLGYLPIPTIIAAQYKPENVAANLESCGLRTRLCAAGDCSIESGALYVWDYEALGKLLDGNRKVLDDAGWPSEPDAFVQQVIREHVSKSHFPNLYSLIARAFGDGLQ